MRYWVIYETDDEGGWSAYAPDVPGCGAAGETYAEARQLIREALAFHIEGLREEGLAPPEPSPQPWAEIIDVDVPVLLTEPQP
jgi:predicted RNase H-like HicB family nuclease